MLFALVIPIQMRYAVRKQPAIISVSTVITWHWLQSACPGGLTDDWQFG